MATPSMRVVHSSKLLLDARNPLASAVAYTDASHRVALALTLRHHSGEFYRYEPSTSYRVYEAATLRAELYQFLAKADQSGRSGPEPFKPTASKVSDILDAVRAVCHLPASTPVPCWLNGATGPPALDLLPCLNGILHLPTRQLLPSTPNLFALTGIDFAFNAGAIVPDAWLSFLHQLWPGDIDAQGLLQEWLGYLLTARTHFQKMLLLVGPKRSGKGTIGRVIRRLIGETHAVAPTLANLGEQFGLAALIDRPVAIIADARISGRADMAVLAERLLSVSGEDMQSIPRKFLIDWTGVLPTRFTLMTNELPRIEDASGALASRFLVLLLEESFYGREDHQLFDRFIPELPGILNWALEGFDRLMARGRFLQPASSEAVIREFEDLGSPIAAFLRDRATTGNSMLTVEKSALYDAWKDWCKETGREHPGTTQTFGRNLRAALPFLRDNKLTVAGGRAQCWIGIALGSNMTNTATF